MLTKWSASYMDKVVSISQGLQDLLVKGDMAIIREEQWLFLMALILRILRAQVKPGELRYGDPQIIIVGRLVPVKQHHLVLKIMPLLIEKFSEYSIGRCWCRSDRRRARSRWHKT